MDESIRTVRTASKSSAAFSHFRVSSLTEDARSRLAVLAIASLATVLLFPLVKALVEFSFHDDRYIQIVGAPLIALFLIYCDRDNIFRIARYFPQAVPAVAAAALSCLVVAIRRPAGEFPTLFATACIVVALWVAVFLTCCGPASLRRAAYPLGCFLFAIPVPPVIIDRVTAFYQNGSEWATYLLFHAVGVSVLRNGSMFSIPGLDFNIAPECSGIRSGMAFLLVAVLAGRVFLRSGWARIILVLSTVPVAMFKNAVRIVVTTSLGAYVDRAFIDGPFHHEYGGIIFAPVDFLLFIPLLYALLKVERPPARQAALRDSPVFE